MLDVGHVGFAELLQGQCFSIWNSSVPEKLMQESVEHSSDVRQMLTKCCLFFLLKLVTSHLL